MLERYELLGKDFHLSPFATNIVPFKGHSFPSQDVGPSVLWYIHHAPAGFICLQNSLVSQMKQQPNTMLYIWGESIDVNSESLNINYYTT